MQLEHAILNLAINARDAMPEGGTITLATQACVLDGTQPPGLNGRFVRLAVIDTGQGMTEADRQRAFEPFFTTKEIGKGSGLGLSHVYGLAEQSGGTAVIESRLGHGTTIVIYLPAAAGAAADTADAEAAAPALASAAAGASVLLVEDDDDVRGTVADLLAASGCEVRAFGSPRQALDTATASDGFQLIIADYAMPEMRGDELVAALRRAGISAPALYITGYASPDALKAEARVLHKPFRASELIGMVETAIREQAGRPTAGVAQL